MKAGIRTILFLGFIAFSFNSVAQVNSLEANPEKERIYNPYMVYRHGGTEGLAEFKKNKPHEYLKELWYYSESFYIKRNYLKEGIEMDASAIAIDRFEASRKETEEAVLVLPGFRDALVLLPINQLIYKP
ncbi:MAG: hypothetical protein V4635_15375 [Bacteroidota bacterium]